jgi:acyl carrier protein
MPAEGIAALETLLESGATQVSVLRMDWPRYVAQSAGAGPRAFLTDVLGTEGRRQVQETSASVSTGDLRRQFEDAPAPRRRSVIAKFVNDCALRILGMATGKAIDPSIPLGELGLDSLLAVELRNTLSSAVGQPLPATLLFDYPTIDSICDYFVSNVLRIAGDDELVSDEIETLVEFDLVGSVEGLSDEEVDRLLATRIGNAV